ncbi:hypothetical protein BJ138DRAFT_941808 [Hygrophoropsis aurantiaca]|uniref:Uncharacterized protein n=1 Tax=Hygrophoropsis aurantiaca TaxID=72124 RepID=A0ACB8ADX4_9AGAM|nr:hypothetical protein BJ138DRAFT_941808 [Hygrophoropsis aurantiaca]
MKLEEGHLNNNAANDDALSEVTAQRNSTMAEVARLRNESAQRTREAAELQNKVDSLTMELSDVKRQLRDAQRQLQQFREQKTTGNLNSETLVVDLCTPEPENRPAKFEVPAQGSTSSDDKVSIPSKRRNSDISTVRVLQLSNYVHHDGI